MQESCYKGVGLYACKLDKTRFKFVGTWAPSRCGEDHSFSFTGKYLTEEDACNAICDHVQSVQQSLYVSEDAPNYIRITGKLIRTKLGKTEEWDVFYSGEKE